MKRINSFLSLLAAAAVMAVSCAPEIPADSITVSPTTLSFEASENQPVSIDIKANTKWTAKTTGGSWLHIAPASGTGDCVAIITVDDNIIEEATTTERKGMVTFVAGTAGAEISVSQKGAEYNPPVPPTPPATEEEKTFSFASALEAGSVAVATYVDGQLTVVTADGVSGQQSFKATVPIADNYLLVAPATALENGLITIPAVQDGSGAAIMAAAVAKENISSIALAPLAATVSFSFPGETLTKAVVIPQGLEESIAGSYSVTNVGGAPVLVANEGGARAVTVPNPTGTVKVSVMPAVYSSGIAVRPYTMTGITTGAFADGEQALTAGTQATAVVTKELSAAPEDDLYGLLGYSADADTCISTNNAFRLYGTTVKLAAGEYNPSRTLKIKYLFGDFNYKVNFTIQGVEGTIITGDGKRRIVELDENTDITIKNITFKDAAPGSGDGGAFLCYGAKASISNCAFINNKVASKNDKNEPQSSGACISASASSDNVPSAITVTDCTFEGAGTDLVARNGGAVYTSKNSSVTCTGCTFKNLATFNTGGAANNSGGTQEYVGCTFEACMTQAGAGAALHANAEGCVLKVKSSTFKECCGHIANPYATVDNKASGVISIQKCTSYIDGCTFDSCEASAAGVIYVQNDVSLNKISNCVFKGNKNASRGLIQINGNSVTFVDHCLFDGNITRTNAWGRILHGGNPAVICFNDITIANHTNLQTGGNTVMLNNDGSTLLANSTVVSASDLSAIRNTNAGTNNQVCVLNSIVINENAAAPVFGKAYDTSKSTWSSLMRAKLTTAYNRFSASDISANGDMQTYGTPIYTPGTGDITNLGVSDLGLDYNAASGCFLWNGPEGGDTKADSESVAALMKAFNPTVTNNLIDSTPIGEQFYNWIVANGNFDKSYNGVSRGKSWWPGSYQKNN